MKEVILETIEALIEAERRSGAVYHDEINDLIIRLERMTENV